MTSINDIPKNIKYKFEIFYVSLNIYEDIGGAEGVPAATSLPTPPAYAAPEYGSGCHPKLNHNKTLDG